MYFHVTSSKHKFILSRSIDFDFCDWYKVCSFWSCGFDLDQLGNIAGR